MSNVEAIIKKVILELDVPFKMSDLFRELEHLDITDKAVILSVLSDLLDCGLVEYSDIQDDAMVFCSAFAN